MRAFSTSARAAGKTAVSIVPPVHHTVKFRKSQLMDKYASLQIPRSSVTSPKYRPQRTCHDRVREHHINTVESDMMLITYAHNQQVLVGNKPRPRKGDSPYQLYQPQRVPYGGTQATKDIKVRSWRNVPMLEAITINCFVKPATMNHDLAAAAKVMLQQITGEKPTSVYARTNVPSWTLRPGMPMGAKIKLTGQPMNQFLTTLTEIVLPRSKTFTGVSNSTGDQNGNITFSLTADDIRHFPEIEGNLELWPQTFAIDLCFHTSAQVDPEARTLLSAYGLPFVGKERYPARW